MGKKFPKAGENELQLGKVSILNDIMKVALEDVSIFSTFLDYLQKGKLDKLQITLKGAGEQPTMYFPEDLRVPLMEIISDNIREAKAKVVETAFNLIEIIPPHEFGEPTEIPASKEAPTKPEEIKANETTTQQATQGIQEPTPANTITAS